MPQQIIYPIFFECCPYAKDIFWKNIFEDLAYGRTPYGTYFNNGFLTCGYKNKEFSYKIDRKDPEILYNDITHLLINKLGLLSREERDRKREEFNEIGREEPSQEWSGIRKKNIKDTFYENYVIDMKNKYNLNNSQCKYLLSVITISILLKSITNKDIIYEGGKIIDILGIEFENEQIIIKRPLYSDDYIPDPIECQEEEVRSMSDNWNKYLKQIQNQII